ncbi:alpha/beta-type small acid-soluble spore protein [Halobacillus locisalis]|uniref:Alpha/beta-type small acid-soluble spore protein n=1 Tax=Halobacillus locisalis TaxID=220753 RepID=A0A838CU79_9BACI|nr:alpha/beta-type small acid-soluble spore protein [Halobacillus locisalis]MBA2175702.1 alpha/beta-type small acid-soluble spore protein [Halobacillus locisalis]
MNRRNKILVPEAREGLDQLKAEIAKTKLAADAKYEMAREKGVPLQKGYNGDLTTRQAGKIGGSLGGQMVKELVLRAQTDLQSKK